MKIEERKTVFFIVKWKRRSKISFSEIRVSTWVCVEVGPANVLHIYIIYWDVGAKCFENAFTVLICYYLMFVRASWESGFWMNDLIDFQYI